MRARTDINHMCRILFDSNQIIKPNKIRNVWQTGQIIWKSVEWKGQLISAQSLPYIINAYWQNVRTSVLSGRPSLPCISTECVEQINTVEGKSWKFSLRKAPSVNDTCTALPGSQHLVSFCKKKKRNYCQNLEDSCRPRIWRALIIVNVHGAAIAKCLQENFSTICCLYISLMVNEGIGFCKYQAKSLWTITFALGSQGWIN